MVEPKQSLINQVKQGDIKSLITVLNRQLANKGIHVIGRKQNNCLQLIVESKNPANEKKLTYFLVKTITKLETKGIRTIKLYGKQSGQDFIDWESTVDLSERSEYDNLVIKEVNSLASIVDIAFELEEIDSQFSNLWIGLALGVFCSIFTVVFGYFGVMAGVVFASTLIYKCWEIVQDIQSEVTPRKAVGYCYIPFYNLYWFFTAYYGLVKNINAYIDENGLVIQKANEELALAFCILAVLSVIPIIGTFIGIAALIILFLVLKDLKRIATKVLRFRGLLLFYLRNRHLYTK